MIRTPLVAAVCTVVLCIASAAHAITRSWDDGAAGDKLWSNANDWSPNGVPALGDDVLIGNLPAAAGAATIFTLTVGDQPGSLTLSAGASVDTNGRTLVVNSAGGSTGIVTLSGANTFIRVAPHNSGPTADSLDADKVIINSGALVSMEGGVVEIDAGQLEINSGGELGGYGRMDLEFAGGGQVFENSGRIFVTAPNLGADPGTLTVQVAGAGTGTIDLDGDSETGVVDADDGATINSGVVTLVVDGPLADAFSGTLNIGAGDAANIVQAWSASGGTINFNGGAGTATLKGGALTAVNTTINVNSGTARLASGLTMTSGELTLSDDTAIEFNNPAQFTAASSFVNNDRTKIHVTITSQLEIGDATVTAGEDFDWDGGGFAQNETIIDLGQLHINVEHLEPGASMSDQYDGTITLNQGTLDVQVADGVWVMDGKLSIIDPSADLFSIPLITGSALHVGNDNSADSKGAIELSGAGLAIVRPPITFFSDAELHVLGDADLFLSDDVTFNSVNGLETAQFTGHGAIWLDGETNVVNEATTFNMPNGRVVLHGSDAGPQLDQTLTLNGDLTLNVMGISEEGNDFGKIGNTDRIVINNATLAVNLTTPVDAWTLSAAGVLNLNNTAAFERTLLRGSDVNVHGVVNVSGNVRTDASVHISGAVNIGPGSGRFTLAGGEFANPNRMEGGTIAGAGALDVASGKALDGFGLISAPIDSEGLIRADGGLLTISGPIVHAGTLGTLDPDGTLRVTNSWNTATASSVYIRGGVVEGAAITNDNASAGIHAFGQITSQIINNTRIVAYPFDFGSGQTLVLDNSDNDWDGASNAGQLIAGEGLSANLELRDNAPFPFHGTVSIDANSSVFAKGFELEFEPDSSLSLANGAKYRSTAVTHLGGSIAVAAGTASLEINDTTIFEITSATTLAGDLRLDNPVTSVQAGAAFSGSGSLINLAGRTLTLAAGSNIGVLVENEGDLEIHGDSVAQIVAAAFAQTNGAALHIDISGPITFDRLVLDHAAQIDGTLDLSLVGMFFQPSLNQTFDIISAPVGGVSGVFDVVTQPANMPAGLRFDVLYDLSLVRLKVAKLFSADFDVDGDVDDDDLATWRLSFAMNDGADADGDGESDGADFLAWQRQLGSGVPGTIIETAVPEPPTSLTAIVAAAGVFCVGCRRRPMFMRE